jgi:hypothetical protein
MTLTALLAQGAASANTLSTLGIVFSAMLFAGGAVWTLHIVVQKLNVALTATTVALERVSNQLDHHAVLIQKLFDEKVDGDLCEERRASCPAIRRHPYYGDSDDTRD